MANKNNRKRKNSSSKENLNKKKLLETTLNYLKNNSWTKLNLQSIFKKSAISYSNGLCIVKNKKELLLILNDYFEKKFFIKINKILASNTHEKIFEIFMIKFEIYSEHRKVVIKTFNYISKKPDLIIYFIPTLFKSFSSVLELSNVSSKGITGNLKVEGLIIIFILTFLVWKADETKNMEKTMASIDNYLTKGEVLVNLLNKKDL